MSFRRSLGKLFRSVRKASIVPRRLPPRAISRRRALKGISVAALLLSVPILKGCSIYHSRSDFPTELSSKKSRGKSAKAVFESYPSAATHESAFYKEKGRPGVLIPAESNRENGNVLYKTPASSFRSHTHTHTDGGTSNDFFSPRDMLSFLEQSLLPGRYENLKARHVVILNESGLVKGYVSMRARSSLVRAADSGNKQLLKLTRQLNEIVANGSGLTGKQNALFRSIVLELKKMGLLMHFTSMPGYSYHDWRFVEK